VFDRSIAEDPTSGSAEEVRIVFFGFGFGLFDALFWIGFDVVVLQRKAGDLYPILLRVSELR
jgi:hypothetical protein